MVAVQEALTDARLDGSQRIAFISGTTVAGMDQTECYYPDTLSADMICQHPCGNSTNSIADHFGCFDYTTTASTACSSALNAIILGKLLIESKEDEGTRVTITIPVLDSDDEEILKR